ncbi:MAG: hypothetical protein EAY75_03795 [Bacteroidetes bacterium]|nr:MAG: hypothetical protein EAY75_03795 [Bacteroidota bacterium]
MPCVIQTKLIKNVMQQSGMLRQAIFWTDARARIHLNQACWWCICTTDTSKKLKRRLDNPLFKTLNP